MKLDIEAMAREADDLADKEAKNMWVWHLTRDKAFARLIVERCAEVCEATKSEYQNRAKKCELEKVKDMHFFGATGAFDCATAIRNLLED